MDGYLSLADSAYSGCMCMQHTTLRSDKYSYNTQCVIAEFYDVGRYNKTGRDGMNMMLTEKQRQTDRQIDRQRGR